MKCYFETAVDTGSLLLSLEYHVNAEAQSVFLNLESKRARETASFLWASTFCSDLR